MKWRPLNHSMFRALVLGGGGGGGASAGGNKLLGLGYRV